MNRDQLLRRLAVRQQILTCQQCDLGQKAARVPFSGPTPADFIVLGEAPGASENRRGEPFTGMAGRLLRRMMRDAGLDERRALFVNTVSCCPWRTPKADEIRACRPNLTAQLDMAGTRFVLTVGQVALQALASDAHVRRLHGAPLKFGKFRVVPVYHPSYVLREPSEREVVVEGMAKFLALMMWPEGDELTDTIRGEWCVACEHKAMYWDDRLMPYCYSHRNLSDNRTKKERRERKAGNKAAQGRLGI